MNGYGEYRSATGDLIKGYFQNDNLVKVEKDANQWEILINRSCLKSK